MDPVSLQDLFDEISRDGGDLAEFLKSRPEADLQALEDEAIAAGRTIATADKRTSEDAAQIETILSVAKALRTEAGARAEAQAEIDSKMGDLMGELDPEGKSTKAEEETSSADATEQPEAVSSPSPSGSSSSSSPGGSSSSQESEASELEPVLAADKPRPRRVNASEIARRAPKAQPPAEREGLSRYLTASANVPGVNPGSPFGDWGQVAGALSRQWSSMGTEGAPPIAGAQPTYGSLAAIHRPPSDLVAHDAASDFEIVERAGDERRLSGGSLTAAGGWCSPSEILYDILDDGASLDGILTLPNIRAPRGGVQYTTGPDFCTVYATFSGATASWSQTEAQVIAATVKPCFEIPCPSFSEVRLDALGFCLTGGILNSRSYPELTADWLRKSTVAFAHYKNAYVLAKILAGSTNLGTLAATGAGVGGGLTGGVLSAIELQVQTYRERHRQPLNTSLELLAPFWVKSLIRIDLAMRTGVELTNVSDAQIDAHFATRGVNVQYLYDWQPLNVTCSTNVTDWNDGVTFIMYKSGTWVQATQDIITIDARYDSSLTATNKYGVRFQEEGLAVFKRGFESVRFTLDTCPSGVTSAASTAPTCQS